jgi:hypothetical protein
VNLPRQTLSLSLHDDLEGQPLTPENVDLLTLHTFMGEVIDSNPYDVSREIDEEKLKALWRKGKEAWVRISSPTEWVEDSRAD